MNGIRFRIKLCAWFICLSLTLVAFSGCVSITSSNPRVREQFVNGTTDQTILAMVARKDVDPSVRMAATRRLTDQSVVKTVATEDEDGDIRRTAVNKLADKTVLATISQMDPDADVRRAAMDKLTDPTALARIAIKDADAGIRRAAMERISDQEILAKFATKSKNPDIRKTAVSKLADKTMLATISQMDPDADVRRAAMDKLTDPVALARIAIKDADAGIRRAATERISDRTILAAIATKAKDGAIRKSAVDKLNLAIHNSHMMAPPTYEWLAGAYMQAGATDDAVLALLMSAVLHVLSSNDNTQVSLAVFEQATELRNRAAIQTSLKSLVQPDQERTEISTSDLMRAIGNANQSPLHCRDTNLVADAVVLFRENLTQKPATNVTNNVHFLEGDAPFISAFGLSLLQRREDWPYIERNLATDPYMARFFPYLQAVATNHPEMENIFLNHASGMVRANAYIALGKSASREEPDSLVRVAGSFKPAPDEKGLAVRTLEDGLIDDRHVVRRLAILGLTLLDVDVSRDKIERALICSDEWQKQYCKLSALASFLNVESDPTNSALSAAAYSLFANNRKLSEDDYRWLIGQIRTNLPVIPKQYWVISGDNPSIVNGYPIEDVDAMAVERINATLSQALAKHASDHPTLILNALLDANPYARMVLLQGVAGASTNAGVRNELWRIAESASTTSDENEYEEGLAQQTIEQAGKGLMFNQTVNTWKVREIVGEVVQRIHAQNRRLAIAALATGANNKDIARLAPLLSDPQSARALVPILLVQGKEAINKFVPAVLLTNNDAEVRMAAAILRLYVEDEPMAREVLESALSGKEDLVEFTAKVALAANNPALCKAVRAANNAPEMSLAGHLSRRVEQQLHMPKATPQGK